jgi:hypothetical protein
MMQSKTAWDYYFTGTSTLIQSQEYGTRQNPSSTNVYVLNCLFRSITSSDTGGALSCTSVTSLLVESSSFFSCKTSGSYNGGAIYFSNSDSGQCVLYGVGGFDCFTGSSHDGQFSYIIVDNGTSSKNYVNYSSITRCVNGNTGSRRTVFPCNGKICFPSVNMSMNKCGYRPAFLCLPYSDSNSFTCSLTYSSIADNNATVQICIWFNTGGANYEIKSCNIIRNIQANLNNYGTITTDGALTIQNSCILKNIAPRIFHASSSYPITLSNCTVDSTSNNGYLTTKNTVTKSFIHALKHLSSRNCYAEYDSAGTLTPIAQSSKKERLYYTCKRFFNQPPQINFISLVSVIIFKFIYPYASSDLLY